jgi:CheY-like chemotaxis protein
VLVVDGDADIREAIVDVLHHAGCEVCEVRNGWPAHE